jgi:hypothetical protein
MGSEWAQALYKGKYLLQMMLLGDCDADQLQTPPRELGIGRDGRQKNATNVLKHCAIFHSMCGRRRRK